MWTQTNTVLEVEQLSKLYSRVQSTTRQRLASTFSQTLLGHSPKPPKELQKGEFWSLKDINFTLNRGEALGVIGFNGAGKTTLLRLLAGQLLPDEGEIRIMGKASAMIDLTAGFQMAASGSRNIYLRGAMLGRRMDEIAMTYDEIVDFAELGDALDAPVSTYSSGMLMRLAFSIMVAMKPDVLFIDEILSVGDFRFQQKCLSRIRELRANSAIVLVSHSMSSIKQFCDQVILLGNGKILFQGDPSKAVEIYEDSIRVLPKEKSENRRTNILGPQMHNKTVFESEPKHYWCDKGGNPITELDPLESLYFKVRFRLSQTPKNLILGIPIWTEDDIYVTGFSTEFMKEKINAVEGEITELVLEIPRIALNPGNYISVLGVMDGIEFLYRHENPMITINKGKNRCFGAVTLPYNWLPVQSSQENI